MRLPAWHLVPGSNRALLSFDQETRDQETRDQDKRPRQGMSEPAMHALRSMFLRACLAPAFALVAATIPPGAARAFEARDLAGWWVAVDETFPSLWRRGDIAPMEELLIVTPDGRAENRVMTFEVPNPITCAAHGLCTDAPLIATARLALTGDLFTVGALKQATTPISFAGDSRDAQLRRIAVTATSAWIATEVDGLLVLRSATSDARRAFARIAPDRLRAVRAGLQSSGLSAQDHWRCLLANATAADPAFAALRGGHDRAFPDAKAPAFLDAYLRAASYSHALLAAQSTVVSDDPDPKQRVLKSDAVQHLMAVPFGDIAGSRTVAERERLLARRRYLSLRARGLGADAAAAHEEVAPRLRGEPVKLPLADSEIAAFGRVLEATDRPRESADGDVRTLFCVD